MKKIKLLTILSIVLTLLAVQSAGVFAAPALQEGFITGTVTEVTCEIDSTTSTVIFLVTIDNGLTLQVVRLDQATALAAGALTEDAVCNENGTVEGAAIGANVSIDPATVIPEEEEPRHPVGDALSQYFSDITDYDTIMAAHEDGMGFGLIVQALWLTQKMEGDSETFLAILDAKKTKDFSAFVLEDGSIPTNWGQFKKAVLNGDKKNNLGVVMSHRNNEDKTNNGNGNGHNNDKTNNGNGQDKKKDKN